MAQTKCDKCGKLAHSMVDGMFYCKNCAPKPAGCTCGCEQPTEATPKEKKSWWESLKDLFISRYANYSGPHI